MRTELRKILAVVMVLALAVSMFAMSVSATTNDLTAGDFIVATPDETTPDEVTTPDEPVATPDVLIYGDVNLNGEVTISDATEIQKAVAALIELSDLQAMLADVDADSEVTIKDATEIQKYIALLPVDGLTGVIVGNEPTVDEKPVVTPDEPVVTPDEPVVTPDEPVVTPDEPVVTPDEPVVTPDEPVVVEKVLITFYTAKTGWVKDADAYVLLIDTDTNEVYETIFDGENSWTAEVPETVVNIRFDRCDPNTGDVWNSWTAADRGEAKTFQTDGDFGVWNDEIAETSEVTIYFDNSVTKWDYVAFYQWSDSSFAQYTVMTQIEDTDIWTLTINSNITTGLFKGSEVGKWEPILQTANITVDTAANGNNILFTVFAGAEMWETTAAPYEG